ncbi:MAG: hypothetical protein ACQCN4_13675 [Candidatus Bathyarchaeia archaeon]|jgi:hypothetical protein
MHTAIEQIEAQIREYAANFVGSQYGEQSLSKLSMIRICAVDAYETGGISEATGEEVRLAARRDIESGRLTCTTKLILRHELGHIFDESLPDFPEFEDVIKHEKIAWDKAKVKNAAEKWYENLSIRTHLDPLKMLVKGFPRPETKISPQKLRRGIKAEIERMKKGSRWVDKVLAERYAMARLVENPNYYDSTQ